MTNSETEKRFSLKVLDFSESFPFWLKKLLPDHAPEPALCTSLGGSERCDLLLCFFWDLSQSEKLFEI